MTVTNKNRWKGHCYMCGMHKDKRRTNNQPFRVLRQLGAKRRLNNLDV